MNLKNNKLRYFIDKYLLGNVIVNMHLLKFMYKKEKVIMYIPEIPNNSLTSEIEEIVKIARAVDGEAYFEFNEPATEAEIEETEKEFETQLPESYKDWVRFSNGSVIFNTRLSFFSIHDLKRYQISKFPQDLIIIGQVVGDGEILCISKSTGKFIRCFDGEERSFDNLNQFFVPLLKSMRRNAEELVGSF